MALPRPPLALALVAIAMPVTAGCARRAAVHIPDRHSSRRCRNEERSHLA